MTPLAYDVVILGAGIVGAACADECARHGMRVALIDRDGVGGGATAAGMGHLVSCSRSGFRLISAPWHA